MTGLFDFFYDLAPVLVEPTTSIPLVFKRREVVYNAATGVETVTETTANILGSPPTRWTEDELADDPQRSAQLRIIVAQKTADDAGLELKPDTEDSVYCTRQGEQFKVNLVRRIASGDREAVLILGLER